MAHLPEDPGGENSLDLQHGLRLTVDSDGRWVVLASNGNFPLRAPNDYYRLLSLLERPYADVLLTINAYREKQAISLDFPMEAIVRVAFICKSENLAKLALAWFAELPRQQRVGLTAELREIAASRWASQNTRQVAKRELKRVLQN
jgi:hypothetical protein